MRGNALLPRAYAHNDEEQAHPLHDALRCGFTAVEADVWAVDGRLLIGHDEPDPNRTLQDLYLDPLVEIVAGNVAHGLGDGFELFVDVKTDAHATYQLLKAVLADYRAMLTEWRLGEARTRAVTVLVTGNADPSVLAAPRYAGYDGRLLDLDSDLDPTLMPVVSDYWPRYFTWRGTGSMPAEESARLDAYVHTAHARGHRLRFWGSPDEPGAAREAVWSTQLAAGVDYLNTDDLAGLCVFLTDRAR